MKNKIIITIIVLLEISLISFGIYNYILEDNLKIDEEYSEAIEYEELSEYDELLEYEDLTEYEELEELEEVANYE
jgi:hypothetical protein